MSRILDKNGSRQGIEVKPSSCPGQARPGQARPEPNAEFVVIRGADGFVGSLPLKDILADGVLLADRLNGKPLGIEHGAPLRLIAPAHYGYKNVKHITAIEFWTERPEEAKHILEQSRARGVFTVDDYRGQSLTNSARDLQAGLPRLEQVLSTSEWQDFFASGKPATALPEVRPDDPAQLQYTSGTTGFPKGARLRHRGITNNARLTRNELARQPCAYVSPMPLFHTGGCVLAVLGAASAGDHLVMLEQSDPAVQLELIEAHAAVITAGVPTMLIAAINNPNFETRDISSLKYVLSGGAMVPPNLVQHIENCLYGHPSVATVAVVGVPDDVWGEQVAAVIQPADPDAGIEPAALAAFCREKMAPQKVPRLWYATAEFPLTGSGKNQKFNLVEQIEQARLQPLT